MVGWRLPMVSSVAKQKLVEWERNFLTWSKGYRGHQRRMILLRGASSGTPSSAPKIRLRANTCSMGFERPAYRPDDQVVRQALHMTAAFERSPGTGCEIRASSGPTGSSDDQLVEAMCLALLLYGFFTH